MNEKKWTKEELSDLIDEIRGLKEKLLELDMLSFYVYQRVSLGGELKTEWENVLYELKALKDLNNKGE